MWYFAACSSVALAGPSTALADGGDLNWLSDRMWLVLLVLVASAMMALTYGRKAMRQRHVGPKGLPQQNPRVRDFDLEIAKLDDLPIQTIAATRLGPTHLRGRIVGSASKMGGKAGQERIWYNLAGASKESAVAVDWCVLQDHTGQAVLVNLAQARVIAPFELNERKLSALSLCLGDEVEVLGILEVPSDLAAYRSPDDDSSVDHFGPYGGLLGGARRLQIKVVQRLGVLEGPVSPAAPVTDHDEPSSDGA